MSAGRSAVDLSETVWARAFRDTKAFCLSFRGLVVQGFVGGLPAGLVTWLLADPATPTWVTALVTALSGIVGFLAVVAVATWPRGARDPCRARAARRPSAWGTVPRLDRGPYTAHHDLRGQGDGEHDP